MKKSLLLAALLLATTAMLAGCGHPADIIEDLSPETFTVLDQLMPAGPRPARRPLPPPA